MVAKVIIAAMGIALLTILIALGREILYGLAPNRDEEESHESPEDRFRNASE